MWLWMSVTHHQPEPRPDLQLKYLSGSERSICRIIAKRDGLPFETVRQQMRRARAAGLTWEQWRMQQTVDLNCPICHDAPALHLFPPANVLVCRGCRITLGLVKTSARALALYDFLAPYVE